MSLLGFRKPRPFMHHYMYVDERRQRLREIEERARRELGMLPPKVDFADDLHGAFSRRSERLRKRSGIAGTFMKLRAATCVLAIVLLLLLAHYLIVGQWWW